MAQRPIMAQARKSASDLPFGRSDMLLVLSEGAPTIQIILPSTKHNVTVHKHNSLVWPNSRQNAAAVALGGFVHVIGGGYPEGTASVDSLHVKSRSWSVAPALTVARNRPSAVVIHQAIIVCGCAGQSADCHRSCELWLPKASTQWRLLAVPESVCLDRHEAVAYNNRMFVSGGVCGSMSQMHSFNPTTGKWIAHSSLSQGRFMHGSVALSNQGVLVCGGFLSNYTRLRTCELWKERSDQWTAARSLVGPARSDLQLVTVEQRVFAVGGQMKSYTNRIDEYDVLIGQWLPTGTVLLKASGGHATVMVQAHWW